jgi:protoporphyrinogen oxidase
MKHALNSTQLEGYTVTIVGAGFTGLSAAYELAKRGIQVKVVEADNELGGLASAFDVGGEKLDRFYHHWFTNDHAVMELISELGIESQVEINPSTTGMYYSNNFYKLSNPLDLLKFSPLSFLNRIRLGLLTLRVRSVKNWMRLENKSAKEWLLSLGGKSVYKIVWEPLLKGKFGPYAEDVSAVWFWKKLALRGSSRDKAGREQLAYFKGGFIKVAEELSRQIEALGGSIELGNPISSVYYNEGKWIIRGGKGDIESDRVIITTSLPLIAKMLESWAPESYLSELNRIKYIGNICLVLELDRPLSSTYWLNVNDPSFPFVGIIEHTNFEKAATYGGKHIVYLSKYLPHTDALYGMSKDEFLLYTLPYLKKMFPDFTDTWIQKHHLWKARWSQPVVEKHYSQLIPAEDGPIEGLHICSMAQIYPEDRGTNYAIKKGRSIGARLAKLCQNES